MEDYDPSLCLIGKVLSDHRTLAKSGVMNIIKKAWMTKEPVIIHSWDHNHYLFVFKNSNDLHKIVDESPWSIMGFYLALVPWNPSQALSEIDFTNGTFWVQVHGLPFGKLTRAYAEEIAPMVGSLVDVDCIGNGIQLNRCFLRFRVTIDLSKPLCPGYELVRDDMKPLFISFKYERLSNFCYACGRLGHDDDNRGFPKNSMYSKQLAEGMRATSAKRLSLMPLKKNVL